MQYAIEALDSADFEKTDKDALQRKIDRYNKLETSFNSEAFDNFEFVKNCLENYLEHTHLSFNAENYGSKENSQTINNDTISSDENLSDENKSANLSSLEQETENVLDNNVLLISETKGMVFLPYKIADLQKELEENGKYGNIENLIKEEYIVPLDHYKNPIISRFKETFELMKNKERASIIKALSLSLELATNSLLNPAIITACKNLDELDIYLDYLDNDELDKFKIFDVKYELYPTNC